MPTTDPFSWTFDGEDWVAHEWLAALMFAVADRIAGYAGVIVLVFAVVVAGFFRLTAGMQSYGMSRRAIFILVLLWGAVFFRVGVMVLRPQVLTFALMAVLLAELASYETGRRRALWLLPPLFAVWVNLNLTVLFGGVCLAAFALDRLLRGKLERHLMIVCSLSGLALLLNPRGPFLLETALKYRDSNTVRYQYVLEWMEPNFSDPSHLPFLFALPVVPLALWHLVRLRVSPAAPMLLLAYQSFTAIRFIPLFVMLALVFAAWLVWQSTPVQRQKSREPPPPSPPVSRQWWAPAVGVVAVVIVLSVAMRTEASQLRREPNPAGFPGVAATLLIEQYPDARLFNVYDYRGFLIQRFDGRQQVFVDGLEEMYGEPFLREYFSLIYGRAGWQETFDEEGIDAVLIRHIDGLSTEISQSPQWEQVHRSGLSALYVRQPVEDNPSRIGG